MGKMCLMLLSLCYPSCAGDVGGLTSGDLWWFRKRKEMLMINGLVEKLATSKTFRKAQAAQVTQIAAMMNTGTKQPNREPERAEGKHKWKEERWSQVQTQGQTKTQGEAANRRDPEPRRALA